MHTLHTRTHSLSLLSFETTPLRRVEENVGEQRVGWKEGSVVERTDGREGCRRARGKGRRGLLFFGGPQPEVTENDGATERTNGEQSGTRGENPSSITRERAQMVAGWFVRSFARLLACSLFRTRGSLLRSFKVVSGFGREASAIRRQGGKPRSLGPRILCSPRSSRLSFVRLSRAIPPPRQKAQRDLVAVVSHVNGTNSR